SCSGPTSDASDQSKKRRAGKVEGPAKYAEAVIGNPLFVMPGTTNVTDAEEDVVEWGSADWLNTLKFSMTAEELGRRKPVKIQRLIDVDSSGEHEPAITRLQLAELMAECLNLEMVYVDRSKPTNRALTWYVRCTCCAVSFHVWSTCPIEGLDEHLRAFDWRDECLRNAAIGAVKHVTSCEHLALYCSSGERLTGVMGPCSQRGFATRQLRKGSALGGSWYQYKKCWIDSPCSEASPLPTHECVRQWLGR
ncbi:MAG: hypothetical protein GY906_15075, partial [bacterium]|nr:hypothetical protein [bacterium]